MRSASMRETSYSRSVRRRRRNDSVSIRSTCNAEEVRISDTESWLLSSVSVTQVNNNLS